MSRTLSAASKLSLAVSALALSGAAMAQAGERADLPPLPEDMQSAPVPVTSQTAPEPVITDTTERTVGSDGVETIVRTRRIERTAPPMDVSYQPRAGYGYAPAAHTPIGYAPGAAVFEREQWIEECLRRTSGRSEKEKGGIIGGLLGAITGGIIGNRVADGDRLAGTLIGGGVGGLGGVLLGNLIGGGKKGEPYDCEAALDAYLSQPHSVAPVRVASRTIPAPAPAYNYGYAPQPAYYGYAPAYNYTYAPPQQITYVPIRYEQQQRVIVRETVREETYEVPGAARVIEQPAPAPAPRMIKQPTRVYQAPSPKLIKQ